MDFFRYRDGELFCEDVPAAKIAAEVGTACYVYSKATLLHHYRQLKEAFSPLNATICYSIKSCGNLNVCKILAAEGCGFDVTSGGELFRALQAGGDPKKMIYAGVGKTDQEIIDGHQRRHQRVQSRIGSGDRKHRSRGRRDGKDRDRRDSHQSRCRSEDTRQDHYGQEGNEVRRRHRAGPSACSSSIAI